MVREIRRIFIEWKAARHFLSIFGERAQDMCEFYARQIARERLGR